ncbi:hypothetical protein [Streptomyces sp. MST-110588]|uniref:terpene synthase family protein n=1 Tax=Streptomyces sp. MST-110588 TaxID=2833628 RepID=UPI001F5D650B|nr:hypothetical protein [Streptomyces sp. MST-110588]UNO41953.1 hypothetical protein KGS77_23440 [Streptomyces sp. MST-110588]
MTTEPVRAWNKVNDGTDRTPMYESLQRHFPQLAGVWAAQPPEFTRIGHAVERHIRAWAEEHHLMENSVVRDREYRSRLALGIHLGWWKVTDPVMAEIIGEGMWWLTVFDDVHCEERARADMPGFARRITTMMRMLEPGARPTEPGFASALAAFVARLRATASGRMTERVVMAYHAAFAAMLCEALLEDPADVTLEDFTVLRRHVVYGHISVLFAELAMECDLPPEVRDSPTVHDLRMAVANDIGWVNDIYSAFREHDVRGGLPFSLPGVLAAHHAYGLDEAVDRSVAILDAEIARVRRLSDELAASPDPQLRAFAQGMAVLVSSNGWYEANHFYR